MKKILLAVAIAAASMSAFAGQNTASIGGAITTLSGVSGSAKGVALSDNYQFDDVEFKGSAASTFNIGVGYHW